MSHTNHPRPAKGSMSAMPPTRYARRFAQRRERAALAQIKEFTRNLWTVNRREATS
jgi:hypothetical protein